MLHDEVVNTCFKNSLKLVQWLNLCCISKENIHIMMALLEMHKNTHYFFLPQAQKIAEHRRKYERKREEKEIKERLERVKKAREEHERAQRVSF